MKKILFIITVLLSLGFVSCSMPENYKPMTIPYEEEVIGESSFSYSIKEKAHGYKDGNLIYYYEIKANKAFTIQCSCKYTFDGTYWIFYVPYHGSYSIAVAEMNKPHFNVLEK